MLLRDQRISAIAASEAEHLERTGEYSTLKAWDRFTSGEYTWVVVQDELDAARGVKTRIGASDKTKRADGGAPAASER